MVIHSCLVLTVALLVKYDIRGKNKNCSKIQKFNKFVSSIPTINTYSTNINKSLEFKNFGLEA